MKFFKNAQEDILFSFFANTGANSFERFVNYCDSVNLNRKTDGGAYPLELAIKHCADFKKIKAMLNCGADARKKNQDFTMLHFAALQQRADLIDILIEYGARPNTLANNGNNALHMSLNTMSALFRKRHTDLPPIITQFDASETAMKLIPHTKDLINHVMGETILETALHIEDHKMWEALLARGATVSNHDNGQVALFQWCECIVRLTILLRAKANVNAYKIISFQEDYEVERKTVLDVCKNKQCRELIIANGGKTSKELNIH